MNFLLRPPSLPSLPVVPSSSSTSSPGERQDEGSALPASVEAGYGTSNSSSSSRRSSVGEANSKSLPLLSSSACSARVSLALTLSPKATGDKETRRERGRERAGDSSVKNTRVKGARAASESSSSRAACQRNRKNAVRDGARHKKKRGMFCIKEQAASVETVACRHLSFPASTSRSLSPADLLNTSSCLSHFNL